MNYTMKTKFVMALVAKALLCSPLAAQGSLRTESRALSFIEAPFPSVQGFTHQQRKLYFATNRLINDDAAARAHANKELLKWDDFFQNRPDAQLTYGYVDVLAPSPRSLQDHNFSMSKPRLASTATDLKESIRQGQFGAPALIFVPGRNNTFYDGVERLAQLSIDMEHEGVPILFSWPSDAISSLFLAESYIAASGYATFSSAYLAQMIHDVVLPEEFSIIAHSLGAKVVGLALTLKTSNGSYFTTSVAAPYPLKDLVLAAPDIGKKAFSGLRGKLVGLTRRRITLYCAEDRALNGAASISDQDERLGYCEKLRGFAEKDGTTQVRVYGAIGGLTKHSYYENSPEVLFDITKVIKEPDAFSSTLGDRQILVIPPTPSDFP
jgi:esterase/lipase superfamily enzyme